MGLIRRKRPGDRPVRQEVEVTLVTGSESLDVVGESYRQDALWAIVGGRTTEYVRKDVIAILIPEMNNPHDPNAISVWIEGNQVGFLSREVAARYRAGLVALWQKHGRPIALKGQICGGGMREDGLVGYLGVFLDHDPADFGLEPRPSQGNGNVRTGRHEALAAGSGLDNLPADDVGAIKVLRRLLEEQQEPIERHFAYCELEHRLYHCREVFASALDEFDDACEAHHNEMSTIRPALVERFKGIPLLEPYRQICIRKQKAHEWQDVISWADRGIALYGEDSLDPTHLEDLRRRRSNAAAKLSPPASPTRTARPSKGTLHEPHTEQLTCRRCAQTFTREVTRGRKPTLCPSCRETGQ